MKSIAMINSLLDVSVVMEYEKHTFHFTKIRVACPYDIAM